MYKNLELKFSVPFAFDVFFGRKLIYDKELLKKIFATPIEGENKIIFFIEDKVAYLFPDLSMRLSEIFSEHKNNRLAGAPIIMPGSEKNKNMEKALEICSHLSDSGICRHSFVCSVGGGAFLDTVGFAASIAHRGIRQVRFPSTVVSQCDSGIGVKNGVNLFGKKNYAGTFYPPYSVVNDFDLIDSLPLREKIAGAAEAIKVAIIKDSEFFKKLASNSRNIKSGDPTFYEEMIFRCAQLHSEHIAGSGDPFEFGSSRPLDFGHWLAHKLESMSGGNIRHGEAVSIGIASDSFLAMKRKLIKSEEFESIIKLLQDCGLPLWSDLLAKKEKGRLVVLDGLREFREHLGGKLSITLPKSIGSKIETSEIDETLVIDGFKYLRFIAK
ncbi:MAG TPA: 3-dehydroquinate synthase [Victivallales bacterium]|nr:3-dehydroquinate synthase [Victivallales bacterium]